MKKLLVLDIDGTLVNSQKQISSATKQALKKLMEKGHCCMLASGRPLQGMEWAAMEIELDKYGGYLLAYNGAKIVKCDTREVVFERTVSCDLLPAIYDFAKENQCGLISYDSGVIISGNGVNQYIELEARVNGMPIKEVDDFIGFFTGDVTKCLLCVEPEKAKDIMCNLHEIIGNKAEVYRSEPFYIEIMPKNVDKATSIERLLPHIGVSRDNVVVCGDGYNDISMIQFAGIGVAMGNAQDKVKESADIITDTNDNDGLVSIIEKYF